MNSKRLSLLVLLFLGLNLSSKAQCPTNIDFELGNTSVWSYFIGSCCTGGGSGSLTGFTSTAALAGRHTLMSGTGSDPYGFFPVVPSGAGSYTMKLGNSSSGYGAEKARYYIHVPASSTTYSLIYRYAVVLEDAGHPASIQPRFLVNAYDSATGSAIPCAQYNYIATSSLPGFYRSVAASDVYFKSWTTASINLSGLGGTTVGIDFSSGDCGAGGHWGYGYLDLSCGLFAINTISCDTTSITLTSPPGFGHYMWYDSSTFSTVLDTLQTITFAMPSAPITYAVVLMPFTGFGCPDTLFTHIIPSRLAIHKMNDTTVCFGGAGSLTLTTGATDVALPLSYSWSSSGGSLSCSTCANPTVSPTSTSTYVFTVTNAVGCSYTDSIRIAGALVAASISSTNVSCYGANDGSATATPTAGIAPFTYSWSTSPVQHTATATAMPAGTYTLSITDSTGCTGVSYVTITEPPITRDTFVSKTDPTTCGGSDGTITIKGLVPGSTFTFSFDFTPTGSSSSTTMTQTVSASSTGAITLTGLPQGTVANITVVTSGCQYNILGPYTLTDPAPPSRPGVTPPTYCQYDLPSVLTATGSSLMWYTTGGSTGSTVAPTPSTTTPGVVNYYVTQTVANCVSDSAVIPVTVIAKPTAPTTTDTSYCQFATVPALTAGGSNLKWYTVPTGGSSLSSAPTPSTTTVGTTTWYVSQTVGGCESDRTPLTVTILYLPSFTISESRPFLCQHDTLTFSYDGPSLIGAVYNWVLSNGASIQDGTINSPKIVVKFDSLRFQNIFLTAASYGGRCFTTDTLKINVVPEPTASAYIKENICENDTISLALSNRSSNADHFTWDFDGASVVSANSNTGGPYKISFHTSGIHIIKYKAITVEGCEGKDIYDTVKVIKAPDAHILTNTITGTICLEDSLYISAIDSNEYGNSYEWKPAHFFHNTNRPGIWGRIETPGYVSLFVTNAFGCKASDSVLITPDACCKVVFPSAFTPNNDHHNDVFRPIFDGYHRFHSFRITNRWGQTVFESTNSDCEWDGTYGGVPQDMGVYYYFIKFDCGGKTVMEKGDVTLVR